MRKFAFFLAAFALLLVLSNGAEAAVYNNNTGQSYSTIQEAINNASEGHTLIADPGVYQENIIIDKNNITLIKNQTTNNTAIINATNTNQPVINITKNNVQIIGFTIKNGYYGIYLYGSDNTIYNNTITNNSWDGIFLDHSSNNTIYNNTITNNSDGIFLYYSSNNTIYNNTITNNSEYGIYLYGSSSSVLRGNVVEDCGRGFSVEGSGVEYFIQDVDTSNTIDGKPIYYLVGYTNMVYDGVAMGYLALVNCENITVMNVELSGNGQGILIVNTTNSKIQNSNITNNDHGIYLQYSEYNTIYNNTITNNSWHGIYLYSGSSNTIYNNTITNNSGHGIYLSDSNNTISNNTITNNGDGIWLYGSGSNMISGNYFIENRQQIGGDPSGNYWNTTEGGNYWSDYTGDDLNGDGIGDIPYRQDQKPLIVDLMIENLTVTSSTIQVNVRNNGKADITKIDPNAKFPVKITYDSTEYLQYLNSLTPGGEQTITQNITASPGTHNITANILYNETTHYLQNTTIRDANTANNIKNTTKEFKTNITANNLNVTPTSGVAPLNVTVSCKLTNTGEVAGDYTAELKINSAVVDSQTVTVGAGETKTVTFTRTLEAGTYNITIDDLAPTAVTVLRPANITASNLTVTPTSGVAPLNVTASCTLTNTGDVAGDYTAELMINGIVVANQTVTVGAGETKTVTFNRTLGAGTYNVTIDGLAPIAVSVTPAGVSLGDLVSAANMVKAYHERYGRLPSRVVIVGQNYTMSQLLYLLTKATVNINVGNLSPIAPRAVGAPTAPGGSYRSGRLYKSAYVQVAANILSFIDSYGRAPNYASTSLGRIPFQRLVYMYTKIIAFYGTYHRLPNYVTI